MYILDMQYGKTDIFEDIKLKFSNNEDEGSIKQIVRGALEHHSAEVRIDCDLHKMIGVFGFAICVIFDFWCQLRIVFDFLLFSVKIYRFVEHFSNNIFVQVMQPSNSKDKMGFIAGLLEVFRRLHLFVVRSDVSVTHEITLYVKAMGLDPGNLDFIWPDHRGECDLRISYPNINFFNPRGAMKNYKLPSLCWKKFSRMELGTIEKAKGRVMLCSDSDMLMLFLNLRLKVGLFLVELQISYHIKEVCEETTLV